MQGADQQWPPKKRKSVNKPWRLNVSILWIFFRSMYAIYCTNQINGINCRYARIILWTYLLYVSLQVYYLQGEKYACRQLVLNKAYCAAWRWYTCTEKSWIYNFKFNNCPKICDCIYYIYVGSSTSFGCWHPSSGARTTAITASGIGQPSLLPSAFVVQ
jgi:hypothetical protein